MEKIYILNGPNLNLLGGREQAIYGTFNLKDLQDKVQEICAQKGCECIFRQTNYEGCLVEWIQEGGKENAGIVLNAGAYTHSSIALQDAILAANAEVIEVHVSNIYARESFRHHSYIAPVARGTIVGLGIYSYILAIEALVALRRN